MIFLVKDLNVIEYSEHSRKVLEIYLAFANAFGGFRNSRTILDYFIPSEMFSNVSERSLNIVNLLNISNFSF